MSFEVHIIGAGRNMSDQIRALLNDAGVHSVEELENAIAEFQEKLTLARAKGNDKVADRLSEKLAKRQRLQKDIAGKTFCSIGLYYANIFSSFFSIYPQICSLVLSSKCYIHGIVRHSGILSVVYWKLKIVFVTLDGEVYSKWPQKKRTI